MAYTYIKFAYHLSTYQFAIDFLLIYYYIIMVYIM